MVANYLVIRLDLIVDLACIIEEAQKMKRNELSEKIFMLTH